MASKNKTADPLQYLLIKLQHIQYRSPEPFKDNQFVYFSFSIGSRMYFSSCMDAYCPILTDDIVMPIQGELPDTISLNRWQNHMIMLTHQIDISELKTRTTSKKKHQTKPGQILSFMVMLLTQQELKFGEKYVQSISQHYLIIQQMVLKQKKTQNRANDGPSFFQIKTSSFDFVMPILDGEICIKLPQTLSFQYIKDGKFAGKSKLYNSDELKNNVLQIDLSSQNGESFQMVLKVRWGINLFQTKAENSLLLQAHQLIIYDIEVRFDSYSQFANSKVKFVYGNKGFEVGNQFNTAKPAKIKKIIYLIIKSEDQQVVIVVERNLKVVAQSKFYTDQINSYTVQTPKRKLLDDNGKPVGLIKFKCEKAKNLSTPNNNKFWKQSNKKKLVNTILLSIQQISVMYEKDQPLCVVIKSQTQQRMVNNVPNLLYYDKQVQISYAPVVVEAKGDQSIFMMVKLQQNIRSNQGRERQNQSQNDFIGIAVLNFAELRLGANSAKVLFFKNQGETAVANCLINKVASYPFVKSNFQPQIMHNGAHKTMLLSIFMKRVIFTPYFYTYRYDNKDEVYCIVEANRLKKVLIMQCALHDDLVFIPSSSSDSLNFYIEDSQYIKIKVTFLVSNVGHEEQIYGCAVVKMKIGEITGQGLKFNKVELKNQFGNEVGQIGMQVFEGAKNSNKNREKKIQIVTGPFKSDIKRVQNDLHRINESMQVMQQSLKKNKRNNKNQSPALLRKSEQTPVNKRGPMQPPVHFDKSINYAARRKQRNNSVAGTNNESIRLPNIKQNRKGAQEKNNLRQLINMMKIRKRDNHGRYEQNQNMYRPKYPASQRADYNNNKSSLYQPPFHTEKGSRQNPTIERGLNSIPRKIKQDQNQSIKNQISQYEQKLKQLKSALNKNSQPKEEFQNNQQLQNQYHPQHGNGNQLILIHSKQSLRRNAGKVKQEGEQDVLQEFQDNQFIRDPN